MYLRLVLEVFGTVSVAAMVLCYSLEERGPGFTLAFAASCVGASIYAFAIGSWPFFALEAVWAAVAARRGIRRYASAQASESTERSRTQ